MTGNIYVALGFVEESGSAQAFAELSVRLTGQELAAPVSLVLFLVTLPSVSLSAGAGSYTRLASTRNVPPSSNAG